MSPVANMVISPFSRGWSYTFSRNTTLYLVKLNLFGIKGLASNGLRKMTLILDFFIWLPSCTFIGIGSTFSKMTRIISIPLLKILCPIATPISQSFSQPLSIKIPFPFRIPSLRFLPTRTTLPFYTCPLWKRLVQLVFPFPVVNPLAQTASMQNSLSYFGMILNTIFSHLFRPFFGKAIFQLRPIRL